MVTRSDEPAQSTEISQLMGAVCLQLGVEYSAAAASGVLADLNQLDARTEMGDRLAILGEHVGLTLREIEGGLSELIACGVEIGPVILPLKDGHARDGSGTHLALIRREGRRHYVIHGGGRQRKVTRRWLQRQVQLDAEGRGTGFLLQPSPSAEGWGADPHSASGGKTRPWRRFWRMMRPESRDLWNVFVFSLFVGALSLATPLAVEAVVNTIAFGRYLQPLVVLSVMVFVFLVFRGALGILLTVVVEIMQRRLFVRTVDELAQRLIRVPFGYFKTHYGPELLNRFFDVMTVQKVLSKLLLETLMLILQTVIGLTVLAFYHPFLLGYDVGLILLMTVVLYVVGRGAVRTATDESQMKYETAAWLQTLARNPLTFGLNGGRHLAVRRADELAAKYCLTRRSHFRIVLRQVAFSFFVQAVAGTLLLGLGGYLVISGQMTLGQLVAAELIVTVILGSFTKIGKHLESIYDLLAAVDKLGKLYDLPVQPQAYARRLTKAGPASVELVDVEGILPDPALRRSIPAGSSWVVLGSSGSGKSRLLEAIAGQIRPEQGFVLIDNRRVDHLAVDAIGAAVDFVNEIELFEGTLDDNLRLGRQIDSDRIDDVLEKMGLAGRWRRLDLGLATEISVSGEPLSQGDRVRFMLARSLVARPRLLLVDGLLDRLADQDLDEVLAGLTWFKGETTLIIASGRRAIAAWADQVLDLTAAPRESSLADFAN